ncbi:hypothetical protein EYF80_003776 [Liparis tanakae]|uniref:Uncharacterized protein n=1 Tax=Liparis tanakae TaxID=230148 RepID=A0A4Z2J8Z4_9TELE|nr:hypothetical protein EYF80_003776 [Liparis tanakae]
MTRNRARILRRGHAEGEEVTEDRRAGDGDDDDGGCRCAARQLAGPPRETRDAASTEPVGRSVPTHTSTAFLLYTLGTEKQDETFGIPLQTTNPTTMSLFAALGKRQPS